MISRQHKAEQVAAALRTGGATNVRVVDEQESFGGMLRIVLYVDFDLDGCPGRVQVVL